MSNSLTLPSSKDLAKLVGTSNSTIKRFRRGENISIAVLTKLHNYSHLSYDDIMEIHAYYANLQQTIQSFESRQ